MDIIGSAGIASAEEFGDPVSTAVIQILLLGSAGIASAEEFATPTGVSIDDATVPRSRFVAYAR